MADSTELTSKALETIEAADSYLQAREAGKDPLEVARIWYWRTTLQDSAAKLESGVLAVDPGHEPGYRMLSEQLDLTRRHINELQEWYPDANVELIYRTLHHQLLTLVGPSGSGDDDPGIGALASGAGTHGPDDGNPI